jgi:hypothetical protein
MFILGLRLAQNCNGVSQLHSRVARRIWAHIWPEVPENEILISHVNLRGWRLIICSDVLETHRFPKYRPENVIN